MPDLPNEATTSLYDYKAFTFTGVLIAAGIVFVEVLKNFYIPNSGLLQDKVLV